MAHATHNFAKDQKEDKDRGEGVAASGGGDGEKKKKRKKEGEKEGQSWGVVLGAFGVVPTAFVGPFRSPRRRGGEGSAWVL